MINYKGRVADRMGTGRELRVVVADRERGGTPSRASPQGGGSAVWAIYPLDFDGAQLEWGTTYLVSFWDRFPKARRWQLMYVGTFTDVGW